VKLLTRAWCYGSPCLAAFAAWHGCEASQTRDAGSGTLEERRGMGFPRTIHQRLRRPTMLPLPYPYPYPLPMPYPPFPYPYWPFEPAPIRIRPL
jgi:hypothetical protein